MKRIFLAVLFACVSVCTPAMESGALFSAASIGQVPGIERWPRSGGSPNILDANGSSALLLAAENGWDDAARLRQMDTEDALAFLKTYPDRSRGEIRAYMLSLNATPLAGAAGCDSYDVAALFDRDYGVRTVTLCYPEAQAPQMTFVLYAETYPVFRERLIDYAGQIPVEFITEIK